MMNNLVFGGGSASNNKFCKCDQDGTRKESDSGMVCKVCVCVCVCVCVLVHVCVL